MVYSALTWITDDLLLNLYKEYKGGWSRGWGQLIQLISWFLTLTSSPQTISELIPPAEREARTERNNFRADSTGWERSPKRRTLQCYVSVNNINIYLGDYKIQKGNAHTFGELLDMGLSLPSWCSVRAVCGSQAIKCTNPRLYSTDPLGVHYPSLWLYT
jgi:hypothetical protein